MGCRRRRGGGHRLRGRGRRKRICERTRRPWQSGERQRQPSGRGCSLKKVMIQNITKSINQIFLPTGGAANISNILTNLKSVRRLSRRT